MSAVAASSRITAEALTVGYGEAPIIRDLDVSFPADRVTTIIGPNGCGKSTLLKSLCRVLPYQGTVRLDGTDVAGMRGAQRARRMTMLPQSPQAPEGITVTDLVSRGRHPHQSWLRQWSPEDEGAVDRALAMTRLSEHARRPLHALSGGQQQRAWIAMMLAQDTPTLLLDEPTTYLDLAYSIELLRLVRSLREDQNRTVVMVLHDLNLAVRYSDHLVAMNKGKIRAEGAPEEIMTPQLLEDVFGLQAQVIEDPVSGGPLVVPQ